MRHLRLEWSAAPAKVTATRTECTIDARQAAQQRTRLAGAANDGDEPLPDVPEHFGLLRVVAEGVVLQRLQLALVRPEGQLRLPQAAEHLIDIRLNEADDRSSNDKRQPQ